MEGRKNYIVPLKDLDKKVKYSNAQNTFGCFDCGNVVIKAPVTKTVKDVEYTNSDIVYSYGGKECNLFIDLPPRYSFGIRRMYPFGMLEEEKTLAKCNGLQTSYVLDDSDDQDTSDEIKDLFDQLSELVDEFLDEKDNKNKLPNSTINSLTAENEEIVKPVYNKSSNSDLDICYFKINTFGSGRNLKVDAKICGPSGSNPFDYIDVRGRIRPMIWIKNIYFGEKVTFQIRIVQMRIDPKISVAETIPDIYDDEY